MKFISWVILPLFASLGLSMAQEPTVVKTAIVTFAPSPLPKGFTAFFKSGNSVFQFSPSPSSLGVPVVYSGSRRFVLRATKEEFELPEDELKLKPPVAHVDFPPTSDLVLILAVPDASGKVQLRAYNVSSEKLRPGNYRVFNFSKKTVSMILGKQKLSVGTMKDKLVDDRSWHEQIVALPLQIATVENNKARLVYSSYWEHFPMRRNLLFLFDGRHPSEPIIFNAFDVATPPKKEPVR